MVKGADKIGIVSNRSGKQLRDRVVNDFATKLEEKDREGFLDSQDIFTKNFPSGEVYVQLQDNVRLGRAHIIAGFYREDLDELRRAVLQLNGDSNLTENFMRYLHSSETDFQELLKILDACRRSGAEKISVYTSIFPDSRQDKKDEPRVPISAKLKFDLIASAGEPKLSRIGLIDIHAKQEQGFTNYPVDHITARNHLLLALKRKGIPFEDMTLIGADTNDYKGMRKYADELGLGLAVILKSRRGHNSLDERSYIEGDEVEGRVCVLMDDMVDTAGTILRGGEVIRKHNAREIYACATHGIFSPTVQEDGRVIFVEDRFKAAHDEYGLQVVTTDTVARTPDYLRKHRDWLNVISVAPLLSDLIYCNETGGSHGGKLDGYTAIARKNDGSELERFLIDI